MDEKISAKSDLLRSDAAAALAILVREICDDVVICTFSNGVVTVPPRRGFALRDAISTSQEHGGTYLGAAVKMVDHKLPNDRLIVITDEQSHDAVPVPSGRAYIVNVASERNGVAYDSTVHVTGWSEAILDFIAEYESWAETAVVSDHAEALA
jgi:60 kDa SS-A/Ro ribonucleoprotein